MQACIGIETMSNNRMKVFITVSSSGICMTCESNREAASFSNPRVKCSQNMCVLLLKQRAIIEGGFDNSNYVQCRKILYTSTREQYSSASLLANPIELNGWKSPEYIVLRLNACMHIFVCASVHAELMWGNRNLWYQIKMELSYLAVGSSIRDGLFRRHIK